MRHVVYCECAEVRTGRPDPRSPYDEGWQLIWNPLCPRHGDDDVDPDHDLIEQEYGLIKTGSGEWIDREDWDDETGERRTA